ncbi:uncharacterized protein LOC130176064 [Seriola aureovittata]|uniref:uncharacterized protein LOC130176064 n=1 Tax=Seriola aureovittata TaxID=2871759 RepID=UPI0024BDEE5A|nr:uncharacterized protein LOC130176064 [Seriola aureovittata]
MARKRLSTEDPVSKLLEDTFSDEDDDGDSAPDSFSSGVEEDFEEGDDLFEDMVSAENPKQGGVTVHVQLLLRHLLHNLTLQLQLPPHWGQVSCPLQRRR